MAHSHYAWCDTHCHFDFPIFEQQREQHWHWLQTLGLKALVIPGISREQGLVLAALCQHKPWFYAQGLHPYFMAQHNLEDLYWLEQQLQYDQKIIAVGEIGLDRFILKNEQELILQQEYFYQQIELAQQYSKPVILHIRGMHDQAASFLRRKQFGCGGIVHAFSGSQQQAKNWLDLGFKLGLGGAFTHSRAHKLRDTIAALPISSWLLETDSPDMLSAFWRGPHHSSAAIPCLAACLAAIKKKSLADIAIVQQQEILKIWPNMPILFQEA